MDGRLSGFIYIRKAIPPSLAEEAAEFIRGHPLEKPVESTEKYTGYEAPEICYRIKKEFVDAHQETVNQLLSSEPHPTFPDPVSITVGIFHPTEFKPTQLKTASKSHVYVTIALTDLNPSNGWLNLYESSHLRTMPLSKIHSLDLRAGDAIVWYGALIYYNSPAGGGIFEKLVYYRPP